MSDDTGVELCPNCVTPWKCNGPHALPVSQELLDNLNDIDAVLPSSAEQGDILIALAVELRAARYELVLLRAAESSWRYLRDEESGTMVDLLRDETADARLLGEALARDEIADWHAEMAASYRKSAAQAANTAVATNHTHNAIEHEFSAQTIREGGYRPKEPT